MIPPALPLAAAALLSGLLALHAQAAAPPPVVAGLALHLDAGNPASLSLHEGRDVLSWSCSINSGIEFQPPARLPQWLPDAVNGHPALTFDGVAQLETDARAAMAIGNDASGFTVFVVARQADTRAGNYFRMGEGGSRSALRLMLGRTSGGLRVLARRLDRTEFAELSGGRNTPGQWVLDSAVMNFAATRAALLSNGRVLSSSSEFLTPGRTSPTNSRMFVIGSDHREQRWRGEIAEILLYNRALGTAELAEVHRYLGAKYSIRMDRTRLPFDPAEGAVVATATAEAPSLTQEQLDLALVPAPINTQPGPEYSDAARDYAMVIGLDRTPGGRLWAAWVAGGDSEEGYFVAATSDDNGETWSAPRLVIDPPNLSPEILQRTLVGTFWTDPTGRLWLFYDQSLGYFDGRAGVWAITCDNPDADTPVWSAPRRIWHGATLNKPLVLNNGEWLLPVSLWTRDWIRPHLKKGPGPPFENNYRDLDPLRMAHVFVSSDQGATWTLRGSAAADERRFDEHMMVELRDGRLWMLLRTYYGLAESYSADQGRTWSDPVPSRFAHVARGARVHLRRLQSGRLLFVKHGELEEQTATRSHLMAFLSDDDGATWSRGLLLDERTGISYPDGFEASDGTICIIYDRNRATDSEILMARFREADIQAGRFHTPGARARILVNKALGKRPAGAHDE